MTRMAMPFLGTAQAQLMRIASDNPMAFNRMMTLMQQVNPGMLVQGQGEEGKGKGKGMMTLMQQVNPGMLVQGQGEEGKG